MSDSADRHARTRPRTWLVVVVPRHDRGGRQRRLTRRTAAAMAVGAHDGGNHARRRHHRRECAGQPDRLPVPVQQRGAGAVHGPHQR